MFYFLAKLFWVLFAPLNLLIWLTLAGTVCLVMGRQALARRLLISVSVLFLLLAIAPFANLAAQPLEAGFDHPALPAHADGILVLSGGQDVRMLRKRGAPRAELSDARIVAAVALARRYPAARIVFSGTQREAPAAGFFFSRLGLEPGRLTLENQSADTFENIRNSQALVHPKPGEVWLLATSAYHVPRALAIARRAGWDLIPVPTDYLSAPGQGYWFASERNLSDLRIVMHEYVGLLAYRLAGRSSAKLKPAPAH